MIARKGDWVQIEARLLEPQDRSPNLPDDTKKVPLEMRVKGFLVDESAEIGQNVKIKTFSGRYVEGKLIAVNPKYEHDFGEPVPELLTIGMELRELLESDKNE